MRFSMISHHGINDSNLQGWAVRKMFNVGQNVPFYNLATVDHWACEKKYMTSTLGAYFRGLSVKGIQFEHELEIIIAFVDVNLMTALEEVMCQLDLVLLYHNDNDSLYVSWEHWKSKYKCVSSI